MILTVLEAMVAPERAEELQAAFRSAAAEVPPGLVRTQLVHSVNDARWRIETLWSSREALDAMRSKGTPAGVLMFRAAGPEPTLGVFTVVSTIDTGFDPGTVRGA